MFEKTRLKLTTWYLVIIMSISLLFSFVIYSMVSSEFNRIEQHRIMVQFNPGPGPMRQFQIPRQRIEPEVIKEARKRFVVALGVINFGILAVAGGAGYFLAGRTLRPIREMVDEQSRFVSDSSHELRTPITSLRAEIEVALRNKKLTVAEAKKILQSNLEEVISLQRLSDNLLELAQNGKLVNKNAMEKVSIQKIVESAIKKVEPSAKSKQIKIAFHPGGGKLAVLGIEDRLVEVFVILLDNAIKYSPKKGKVEAESRKTNGKIEISVIDHGIGIDEKDLPHIFDRFYRGEKSRTHDGYGLGLSIAKKIVEQHEGEIKVFSELNEGTKFIVILPK